jgi:SAM-dependent methyltransferase
LGENSFIYSDPDYNAELYSKLMNMDKESVNRTVLKITKFSHNFSNLNILSLGCGDGQIDSKIIDKKATYYGVDISGKLLKLFNNKVPSKKNINIINGSILSFISSGINADFNLCLVLGILPLFNKKQIIKILVTLYDKLETNGLLVFYIEKKAFRYFEYDLNEKDNYTDSITKNILKTITSYKKAKNIKVNEPYYSEIFWLKLFNKDSLKNKYKVIDKFDVEWVNNNMSYLEIIKIFTGFEKVLSLAFNLKDVDRKYLYYKLISEHSNRLHQKSKLSFGREFILLKKI